MIYDSADVFLLGIDLTLGVVLAKTSISTLPPGKRTAQVYLLTSLNFIPKTAPPTGKMSKIDSKVVGFREAS